MWSVVHFDMVPIKLSINQAVELDSLPRTDSKDFQIYFTGGKPVALTLKETTGGNLPLRYELDQLSDVEKIAT